MARFRALLQNTWWLWIAMLATGAALTAFFDPIFWVTFPICIFTFFWFAFIRYDEDGNFKGS